MQQPIELWSVNPHSTSSSPTWQRHSVLVVPTHPCRVPVPPPLARLCDELIGGHIEALLHVRDKALLPAALLRVVCWTWRLRIPVARCLDWDLLQL